jgi:hypothetical protein
MKTYRDVVELGDINNIEKLLILDVVDNRIVQNRKMTGQYIDPDYVHSEIARINHKD